MRPLKSGGPLRGGYSATTLICLCCISFLGGRFLRELPALPATPTGVRSVRCTPLRYTALFGRAAAVRPHRQQLLTLLPCLSSVRAPPRSCPRWCTPPRRHCDDQRWRYRSRQTRRSSSSSSPTSRRTAPGRWTRSPSRRLSGRSKRQSLHQDCWRTSRRWRPARRAPARTWCSLPSCSAGTPGTRYSLAFRCPACSAEICWEVIPNQYGASANVSARCFAPSLSAVPPAAVAVCITRCRSTFPAASPRCVLPRTQVVPVSGVH